MSSYNQSSIKLQEAMTMELKQNVWVWEIPNFPFKADDIPEDATLKNTFVMKHRDGSISLGREWTVYGELGSNMSKVDEFSSFEELKDKFPQLFELEGSLYVFS